MESEELLMEKKEFVDELGDVIMKVPADRFKST